MAREHPAFRKNLNMILLLTAIIIVALSGIGFISYCFNVESREARDSATLHTQGSALLFESFFAEVRYDSDSTGSPDTLKPQDELFRTALLKDRMVQYDDIHREILRNFVLVYIDNRFVVLSDSKLTGDTDTLVEDSVLSLTNVRGSELLSGGRCG